MAVTRLLNYLGAMILSKSLCARTVRPTNRPWVQISLLLLLGGCSASIGLTNAPAPNKATDTAKETAAAAKTKLLVIAHRGASGYRPEHTIAAYQLAIEQGADFIEPDLVPTRDGHLIARHENALAMVELNANNTIKRDANGQPVVLAATTDVAERPEFSHLLTVRSIDGRDIGGWFSEDFTLAQIETLFARERIPQLRPANARYAKLRIPTLAQIIELLAKPSHQQVGMYPELKHPTHFRYGQRTPNKSADGNRIKNTGTENINIDTAQLLTNQLAASGFTDKDRLFIQCFEVETLRRLRHKLLPAAGFSAPLVQLFGKLDWKIPDVAFHLRNTSRLRNPTQHDINRQLRLVYGPLADKLAANPTYDELLSNLALAASDYAAGAGPRKGDAGRAATVTQPLGLALHPYTVRAEPYFLSRLRGGLATTVDAELKKLSELGATGVFIDQPDLAVRWRDR